jgi:dTDP-4-amino-4,6-dideoxygalactose transaminase
MGMPRDSLLEALKELNIGTSLHYRPVHLFSCYQKRYGFRPGDFPKAEEVGQRVISLPLFPDLSFHDQDRVIGALDHIANFQEE